MVRKYLGIALLIGAFFAFSHASSIRSRERAQKTFEDVARQLAGESAPKASPAQGNSSNQAMIYNILAGVLLIVGISLLAWPGKNSDATGPEPSQPS